MFNIYIFIQILHTILNEDKYENHNKLPSVRSILRDQYELSVQGKHKGSLHIAEFGNCRKIAKAAEVHLHVMAVELSENFILQYGVYSQCAEQYHLFL